MEINIGTRKSKLAMWQAEYVKSLLEKENIKVNLHPIETKGDKILDKSLAKIGSKGVFTEELEEKLLNKEVDIAVHSAKDLQSSLDEKFEVIAFTVREQSNDVLISRKKINPEDKSVKFSAGTSSVRRKALIRHYFENIETIEMRGNLQTRIAKMDNGDCDALVLAKAGVLRMGYEDMIVYEFDPDVFIPPVGQGTLAIESAVNLNPEKREAVRRILNHDNTEKILLGERKYLNILEGGCSIPAFCNGKIINDELVLKGGLINTDGKDLIFKEEKADLHSPESAGEKLAEYVLNNGGREILQSLKH